MPLTYHDFLDDAQKLGCDVATIQAVASVESSGGGFNPDGSPKTLFEGHLFYKFTNGKFAKSHPTLCYQKWTRQFYGKTWQQEKARLEAACKLDREAALKATSWGLFQVCGFNHTLCDCSTVQEFINKIFKDENSQLELFTSFVINSGLADELREHRWADFARKYNGPAYAQNKYDTKLAAAYAKFSSV